MSLTKPLAVSPIKLEACVPRNFRRSSICLAHQDVELAVGGGRRATPDGAPNHAYDRGWHGNHPLQIIGMLVCRPYRTICRSPAVENPVSGLCIA
jgi:hypothetical protein